jgi:hypothetical protein
MIDNAAFKITKKFNQFLIKCPNKQTLLLETWPRTNGQKWKKLFGYLFCSKLNSSGCQFVLKFIPNIFHQNQKQEKTNNHNNGLE